ncbi:MAG: hypothetical protein NZL90_04180 [Aquificaceae bacterium]|nr:hypothetical protein [Aquificaceae bacterium]
MKFYFIVVFLSYIQSSILVNLFSNGLMVPDLVLCSYFLELLKNGDRWGLKGVFSGSVLDILQDSAGLYISRQILFGLIYEIIEEKLQFPSRISKTLAYVIIATSVKLFTILLFSFKHDWSLSPTLLILGMFLEALYVYRFCR